MLFFAIAVIVAMGAIACQFAIVDMVGRVAMLVFVAIDCLAAPVSRVHIPDVVVHVFLVDIVAMVVVVAIDAYFGRHCGYGRKYCYRRHRCCVRSCCYCLKCLCCGRVAVVPIVVMFAMCTTVGSVVMFGLVTITALIAPGDWYCCYSRCCWDGHYSCYSCYGCLRSICSHSMLGSLVLPLQMLHKSRLLRWSLWSFLLLWPLWLIRSVCMVEFAAMYGIVAMVV